MAKKDGDIAGRVSSWRPKATTEVVAPASGTLKIKVPEGKTVPVGA